MSKRTSLRVCKVPQKFKDYESDLIGVSDFLTHENDLSNVEVTAPPKKRIRKWTNRKEKNKIQDPTNQEEELIEEIPVLEVQSTVEIPCTQDYPLIPKDWTTSGEVSVPFRVLTRRKEYTTLTEDKITTPLDGFRVLLTNELIKYLVGLFNSTNQRKKRAAVQLTRADIELYIAVLFHMCVDPSRNSRDYWNKDPSIGDPLIQSLITRESFENIQSSLHFGENGVFTLINKLSAQFKECWHVGEWVSLDESMIPFRGPYPHIRHVPRKPHAWGIMLYCVVDNSQWCWDIMMWKKEFKGVKKNIDIVCDMVDSLPDHEQRVIFADRAFGSLATIEKLLDLGYYATMFTKKDRPSELFDHGSYKLIGERNMIVCIVFI